MIGSVFVALIGSAFALPKCDWSSYTNPITADANLKPVVAVYGDKKYVAVALGKNVYQLPSEKSGAAPTPTTGAAVKIDAMTFGESAAYFMDKDATSYYKSVITAGAMADYTPISAVAAHKVVAIAGTTPVTIQLKGADYTLVNGATSPKPVDGAAKLSGIAVAGGFTYVTGKKKTTTTTTTTTSSSTTKAGTTTKAPTGVSAGAEAKYNVWKVEANGDVDKVSTNDFSHYGGLAVKGDNIYVVGGVPGLTKLGMDTAAVEKKEGAMKMKFDDVYAVDRNVLAHGVDEDKNHKVVISFDDGSKFEALPLPAEITTELQKKNMGVTLGKDGKVYVVYQTAANNKYIVTVGDCKAAPLPDPNTTTQRPANTTKKGSAASTKSTLGFVALLAPVLIFAYV